MMRILLAEDDETAREFVSTGLRESGMEVVAACDGLAAMSVIEKMDFHLVILDMMMPGANGLEVLRHLRARGSDTPVLFLTARDAVADKVSGLESGADDYLVKPFAWPELMARVKSLLRRVQGRPAEMIRVADLELDMGRMKAMRGGVVMDLTAKEFQVLVLMARHKNEIISRRQLAEQVWEMAANSDSNALEVAMGRLRRKVDDPFPRKLIRTIRGAGYILDEPPTL